MAEVAGWWGSGRRLLLTAPDDIVHAIALAQEKSIRMPASSLQLGVWREEVSIVRLAIEACIAENHEAEEWTVIFEFELPLEGGRRPDVVILTGASLSVMEFKQAATPTRAYVDQAAGYARDISDYHAGSHGRHVTPMLVLTRASGLALDFDPVVITGPDDLAHYLLEAHSDGHIDAEEWLSSPYEPLPTLISAARRIFEHKPLPHVHTALAQDIPGTLTFIETLIRDASIKGARKLILVSGVPGSGKTLVGLRLVYERTGTDSRGILLSGNGPLVQVLQHALESRVFVRDLHAFIKTYAAAGRTPRERIIVFDEAQRAWDREYMFFKRGLDASEPELLVRIAERIPEWSVLVGLLGEGQEIYSGEEAGLLQWRNAILAGNSGWEIYASDEVLTAFDGCRVHSAPRLKLSVSLRARRAEFLHDWVQHLLVGNLDLAGRLGDRLASGDAAYPLYVTRDLDEARDYLRQRYSDEPHKHFGLLVAAHAKAPRQYGVDNHFMAMRPLGRKGRIGPWFNAPVDDPLSGSRLETPLTEFQVQGLELDFPIVCWGEDFIWADDEWSLRPARSTYKQRDPKQLLMNAYRVLLTRGRDGLLVFIPPEQRFDKTESAFLRAGMRRLRDAEDEIRAAAQ
jgi:hypothetical protein